MNKLRLILFAVIALVCFHTAQAQIFFKVEKPGKDHVSYILGTHHFAPVELLDSITGLKEIVNSVDKLYGEVDMALMNNPIEMMKYADKMMAPKDSTIDKILTAAEMDTLAATWNKLSGGAAPLQMMYGMKPNVLTTSLMTMILQNHFPDKDFTKPGIDLTMQNLAKENGKDVCGLESVEFQINLLFNDPISTQKEDLMDAVRDGGESQVKETIRLTDAYMARDLQTMSAMMTDSELMSVEKADAMIYDRNASWAEILVPEMQEKSVMVVVGAGHLPTERGLLELLRKAGYRITPVY